MKKFLAFLAVSLFVLASCEPDPILTLDRELLSFDGEGGIETVSVTANNNWNIVMDESAFYTVTPMSGADNGFITISVQPNSSSSARSAQFIVVCTTHDMSVTRIVTLKQAGLL